MADLIVKFTAKKALGDNNVSADFYDELNEKVWNCWRMLPGGSK